MLSVLSGLLFSLAWPAGGFAGLLFISFVPLLLVEDHIHQNRHIFHRVSILLYSLPAFFIWNILTTYWIWNSAPIAGIVAVSFNTLYMSFAFSVYHWVRRNIYAPHSYFALIFIWISFEYLHHNWDLNWPWLSVGNGFASYHKWIQWYEFTGMFGGSFWVLLINILVFKLIKVLWNETKSKTKIISLSIGIVFFLFIPLVISFIIYSSYKGKEHPVNIIVVQPNLDPYTEQYTVPPLKVINRNLDLAQQKLDSATQFIVCPESAIQEDIWERELNYSGSLTKLKRFVAEHPQISVVIGASTFKRFREGEKPSPTARKFKNFEGYYDAYNTAFLIDTSDIDQWTHKSKLTPGVERMPFPKYLKFLENLALDLGGTVGSLGIDKERKVFNTIYDSLKVGTIICYESAFGEFTSKFVRNGANLIFIVTNDGWWGNTPGHRQHFSFARIRAIENRRSIARSANTGISGFINQRGDAFQKTLYCEPAVISQEINANWDITFYTQFGNYIARLSAFITVALILIAISLKFAGKKIRLIFIKLLI